jgi:hypothetical protein
MQFCLKLSNTNRANSSGTTETYLSFWSRSGVDWSHCSNPCMSQCRALLLLLTRLMCSRTLASFFHLVPRLWGEERTDAWMTEQCLTFNKSRLVFSHGEPIGSPYNEGETIVFCCSCLQTHRDMLQCFAVSAGLNLVSWCSWWRRGCIRCVYLPWRNQFSGHCDQGFFLLSRSYCAATDSVVF